jgi:hypothetical protein
MNKIEIVTSVGFSFHIFFLNFRAQNNTTVTFGTRIEAPVTFYGRSVLHYVPRYEGKFGGKGCGCDIAPCVPNLVTSST